MQKSLITVLSALLTTFAVTALELATPFADGMVLQRGTKVPVWGWAGANTEVTVKFAGQTHSAHADSTGRWMVYLPPLSASADGRIMTVMVDGETETIEDVVVGEVWLCSGQSNMGYIFKGLSEKAKTPEYQPIADENKRVMKTAEDPLLRRFHSGANMGQFEPTSKWKRGTWIKTAPGNNLRLSGTAYYFARELRRELKVPVGMIMAARSGSRIQPWLTTKSYKENPRLSPYLKAAVAKHKEALRSFDPSHNKTIRAKLRTIQDPTKRRELSQKLQYDPTYDAQRPTVLFNGMIHPLIPYAIKGALWYQGESNVKYLPDEYASYMTALIEGWRDAWGQGDFPFYYAQLASCGLPHKQPVETDGWATVSNAQRLCMKLPNTGMAVLNDVGEVKDIHPKNKIDVGKRLALWAFVNDYGRNDLSCSGPLYKSSSFSGNKATISFDSVGEGLMVARKHLLDPAKPVDEPLQGFQICGADRQWKWAKATITGARTVDVWHDSIPAPIEVRYAWGGSPVTANLYSKNGLPASVFAAKK